MPEQNVHVRDVVHLKSGSPALTVIAVNQDFVTVAWEDDTGNNRELFPLACLAESECGNSFNV
jgi:uncharacterized protein YodC (DUF2158 family)